MAKSVSMSELVDLQRLVVQSLKTRIELDIQDNLPTDAATLGVAIKLLKDNAVTADPADVDDLAELRDKLSEQSRKRKEKGAAILQLATSDLQVMEA